MGGSAAGAERGAMSKVVGLDGCKGGWVAVARELGSGDSRCAVFADFPGVLLFAKDAVVITVDIPIGFTDEAERGGRTCDVEARRLLGGARASSVFPPPVRGALLASSYSQALQINRASSPSELGISKQCHALFPKMREVDEVLTPERQERVREIHPELCFRAMNGGNAVAMGKRTKEGADVRYGLLWDQGYRVPDELLRRWPKSMVAPDDILDAYAACWTAQRIAEGQAIRIPDSPALDAKGLRMEMWF
jgi:predicted RNase H-like nuclease